MKRLSAIVCIFVVTLSLIIPMNVSAQELQDVDKENASISETEELLLSNVGGIVETPCINDMRNRKTNVNTYYEWSSYRRVSDNLQTGPAGGSITSTSEVTFGTEVSGNISGLGISVHISKKSAKGYTLNVGANRRVYMAYRVCYRVETGTNEYYDAITGKVYSSSSYTVKVPQYGEYGLINY